MKNLEFNQMENLSGGWSINYGEAGCSGFWGGLSLAAYGATPYATAINPAAGVAVGVVGALATIAGMAC